MNYFNKIFILSFFGLVACDFPAVKTQIKPLARVNDALLYKEAIDFSFIEGRTEADSILFVQNIINDWATTQLLIDGAILNLSESTQVDFEELVQQYKSDLYTSAYVEALVSQNIDTLVPDSELQKVYVANKQLFVLKEDLLKLRYININASISNLKEIKKRFKRFNYHDKIRLDSISIQFNSFYLKDSMINQTCV